MKRALMHESCPDPFPETLNKPTGFIYASDMALVRFKEAIKTATGKDALYVVERNYRIQFTLEDDTAIHEITVPAGMLTDLASVPPFARWFVGRVGRHLEAAIVHDFLYAAHRWEADKDLQQQKRKFADQLMLVGMRDAGVGMFKARIMYAVVRSFGWLFSEGSHDEDFLDTTDPEVLARLHPLADTGTRFT